MLNNTIKRLIFTLSSLIVVIAFITLLILSNKHDSNNDYSQTFIFNEIDSLYQGAPAYYDDARSSELSVDETNDILGIGITECIPESLNDCDIYIGKQYFIPDELRGIDISISDPETEQGYGKTLVTSVESKEWSERSTWSIDYIYSSATHESSSVNGISVDAFMRPRVVGKNVNTGFTWEDKEVFIAEFQIEGLKYYVEGREGITQEEFSEFVTNIINSYLGDA